MVNYQSLRQELEKISAIQGISPIDVLALPDPLGKIIRKMSKNEYLTIQEIAGELSIEENEARDIADILVEKGYFKSEIQQQDENSPLYRVYYARMRKRNIPLDL